MLHVRDSVIWNMPKSRYKFEPKHFLRKIYLRVGKYKLWIPTNCLIISKAYPNSEYCWNRLSENIRAHEDPIEEDEYLSAENC